MVYTKIIYRLSDNKEERKNFSYNGSDVKDIAHESIGGKAYVIKRFSNDMIRLFDENDELLKVAIKPVLRRINSDNKLEINLYNKKDKLNIIKKIN
ncbi:MAG: hypothetical protein LBL90_08450 [Prevotellaceae bacterium]|jgi:hypothetical protein|nr:hypothetical protein [Prevotellaceae bacterium]